MPQGELGTATSFNGTKVNGAQAPFTSAHPQTTTTSGFKKDIEDGATKMADAKSQLLTVIQGRDEICGMTLNGILMGENVLYEGGFGGGKSFISSNLAIILNLDYAKKDFTSDTLPADILGYYDRDPEDPSKLIFVEGPVFTQLFHADEINRATPTTQSGLLGAMQNRAIEVRGKSVDLPKPFSVIATQNPAEEEGTYPLPGAQLDRFGLRLEFLNIDEAAGERLLRQTISGQKQTNMDNLQAVLSNDLGNGNHELLALRDLARRIPFEEAAIKYILDIRKIMRPEETTSTGIKEHFAVGSAFGERGSEKLAYLAQGSALMQGKEVVQVSDIAPFVVPAMTHRLLYTGKPSDTLAQQLVQEAAEQALHI